jgi:HK97 family phage portal protein
MADGYTLRNFMAAAARRFLPLNIRFTVPDRRPGETRFVFLPQQIAGVRVTEQTAIQISTVFACLSVISKSLASSTWEVFEEATDGSREMKPSSNLYRLLNVDPNPEITAFSFREALLFCAGLWGNGYAEIERDVMGRAVALWPLHPERVDPERDDDGRLVYKVWNQSGPATILPARDVYHLHGPGIDGLTGYRLARLAERAFGHSIAAETFGAAFYGNGAQMGSVLESDQNLTPLQIDDLSKRLDEQHKGPTRSHRPLLLGGGLKWKQQAVEPEKAQFIETRHLTVEEICRYFGVPPHKIAHLLRATNNNIEHQGIEFVRDGLTPWAERQRQEAEKKLRPANRRGLRTRIALEWLAEGDAKAKAVADSTLVNAGIMSRNEVRKRRGLKTVPDGDKLTVQMNMTTLEKVGEEPPELEPDPPPDEALEDDDDGEQPPLRIVENE